MENSVKLNLAKEWDKTFPKSEKVNHRKVTFVNRYGITLAADLYEPKGMEGKLAAIAVCGPFGAVKEQAAGLYAQTMAEKGNGISCRFCIYISQGPKSIKVKTKVKAPRAASRSRIFRGRLSSQSAFSLFLTAFICKIPLSVLAK